MGSIAFQSPAFIRNWDELWDLLCRALRIDLRGKPSTFSADGTEKLVVGEDGLVGGSLVVSMMTVDGGGGACVPLRV
ncbi:hypothetical protein EYF80_004578 [Liparis tanakae]|uniref:Uncharacterized protein n=1 Tax=Liparis tanakae TaxID=230148 RepID=A0A4Z2J6E9_9TELE|nr:hypothetical protein EYF80_004578 [Liparis tanakae]